jgi:polar amino acid transport system substrate-binding protein
MGTIDRAIIHRRGLLKTGALRFSRSHIARPLRAQAKLAAPNIIKAGTPRACRSTRPCRRCNYVDDKGQLKGMRVELANE